MPEFLFPQPKAALRDHLEYAHLVKKQLGKPFSDMAARVSYMLDADMDRVRSQRDYARLWGWGRKKVEIHIKDIARDVAGWRAFYATDAAGQDTPNDSEINTTVGRQLHDNRATENGDSRQESKDHTTVGRQLHDNRATVTIPDNKYQIPEEGKDKSLPSPQVASSGKSTPHSDPAWSPSDWQAEYALALLHALDRLGVAARGDLQNESDTVQKWAGVFDKLHRLDDHDTETIRATIKWLIQPDNWWIANGNFSSALKLRRKNKDGKSYFEVFKHQAEHDSKPKRNGVRRPPDGLTFEQNVERLWNATEGAGLTGG